MVETGSFASLDNTRLFYRKFAVEKPRLGVVIVHGFAEHSGRYQETARALNEIGCSVLAIDLRGHGMSEGRQGGLASFDQYVEDLDAAVRFACQQFQKQSVLIVAHSMGALVASHKVARNAQGVWGLTMSSPLLGIKITVPQWKKAACAWLSQYWPGFRFPNEIQPNLLSHDPQKVAAYANDPLIFKFVTARWFEEINGAMSAAKDLKSKIAVPLLMQIAGDDHIVDSQKSRAWYDTCTMPDAQQIVYEGFYHEIYNELERGRPLSDLSNWIKGQQAKECV